MFPDQLFTIENEDTYRGMVKRGYELAKDKSILFCGICRNVGSRLERNILRIQYSSQFFKSHHTFIYENNSTDDTVEILQKYRSETLSFVSDSRDDEAYEAQLQSGKDPVHFNRCKVLANCRNEYLKFAQNSNYNIVCVIDLDLWGGWSYNGLLHSIGVLYDRPTNGAVTAYGVLADPYNRLPLEAIDPSRYIMYDCFVFRPKGPEIAEPKQRTCRFNFINQKPGSNPVFVNSNFNGFGLYRRESLNNLSYGVKLWDEYSVDADHVVLHRDMRNNGWDVIFNPSMLVSYADHQYSKIPLIQG